jgi:thiamine-phosphate diphosphorylase
MFPFYFIADASFWSAHGGLVNAVDQALEGGVRFIQYRDKDGSRRVSYENAKALREITARKGATFIVNDQVDLAMAVGADGVHLGQDDLPVWAARKIMGQNRLIGISTHTLSEAISAESEEADYIGFGPVFETKTKPNARSPVGLETITEIKKQVSVPLYAIGGITYDQLSAVFGAGADGVAVISSVSGEIQSNTAAWIKLIQEAILAAPH